MPTYTVKQGDSMISIAHDQGFRDWRSIWDDRGNAALREQRSDPQVLLQGDVVFVPAKEPRAFSCDTEKRHRFQLKPQPCVFCVFLRDEQEVPYAGHRYTLTIEGRKMDGVTSSDGRVLHPIKPTDRAGELKLWRDKDDESDVCVWPVRVGGLDPIDSVSGVQGRLNNLGYRVGAVDGTLNPATRQALKEFQRSLGRTDPTGEIDDATRSALASRHDRGGES
jgi:N-acetylmuramoyl-L-alanine amidase